LSEFPHAVFLPPSAQQQKADTNAGTSSVVRRYFRVFERVYPKPEVSVCRPKVRSTLCGLVPGQIFLSPIGAIFSLHRVDQSFIIVELSVPLSRRRWPDGFGKQIRHIHDRKVHDHPSEVRASSH
jgi:hypothetical protein